MTQGIQGTVVTHVALACCVAFFAAYLTKQNVLPFTRDFPPDLSDGERLTFAFRCLAFSAIPLLLAIQIVASTRFNNPDTLASHPTEPVPPSQKAFKVYQRILQNTLEQTALHVLTVLALVSCLEVDQLYIIPLLVLLFMTGRAAFFLGYIINPIYRAFGFALTGIPTVSGLVYALYTISSSAMWE